MGDLFAELFGSAWRGIGRRAERFECIERFGVKRCEECLCLGRRKACELSREIHGFEALPGDNTWLRPGRVDAVHRRFWVDAKRSTPERIVWATAAGVAFEWLRVEDTRDEYAPSRWAAVRLAGIAD